MKLTYKNTIYACFIGYIVQAIVVNFIPLLFLTFHASYGISFAKITLLVTFNFGVQLITDLLAAKYVDKMGYRLSIVLAHVFSAVGLIGLMFLPDIMPDPFYGLMTAVVIYAIGGGLLEVLVSPIVEACPTDNKATTMSILHSFYCWGQVGVVLFSTIYFGIFGIENWKYLAVIWALVPIFNGIYFTKVPIASVLGEDERGLTLLELFKKKIFWLMLLMMVCSGASEQAVSQWASAFAELGLGVSKTIGDLAGPMMFAVMMGVSRAYYGKFGEKIHLKRFMRVSSVLCVVSYLVISLSPWPILGLLGCALCGLSVGIMWPGTFSLAAAGIRGGGTMMFAFFALAGDVGCSLGPTFVGQVAGAFGDNLKMGILVSVLFPVLMLGCLLIYRKQKGMK